MMKLRKVIAPAIAASLVLAACGGDDEPAADEPAAEEPAAEEPATEDTVDASQGSDLTFHMVTHSDDGPFWSVVKRGMDAACEDVGVSCVWLGSNNDPGVQVQMIEQAIAEGSNGIASALASPDQLVGPLQSAVAAGIPVVTLNSGLNNWQEIGALTHVGQDEIIAGREAGNRF
ncbi:MAG: substrate-binding domain-containing protein, partial [Ilumatobacteraceae bacterium]